MNVLGIDPGCEGALALLNADGTLAELLDLPHRLVRVNGTLRPRLVPAELAALLRRLAPGHAVVEAINPRPGDGPRAGELLRAAGQVEGVLAALGIAQLAVDPRTWRNAMKVGLRGASYEQRKEASRMAAFRLWPGFADRFGHREHGPDRAEAALIAAWGLRFGGLGRLARAA